MGGTSIDVVVCTYNNHLLLDMTLAALAKQKVSGDVEWSIVVVDNNCTDETSEVVARHARTSPVPLKLVVEPAQGLTPARLCGVRNTRAEWVAFVDDDCLLAEDWIEQAARFAVEHPACGAFGGRITPEWQAPPPTFVTSNRYAYAGKNHGDTAHRRSWLAGAGMVVRRESLERCGWTKEQFLEDRSGARLVSGGDMEIGLRVAALYEVWYNPACVMRHVIPARRMTRDYLRRIVYGLGASRHNADALRWRGTYIVWLLYSALYSVGFAASGAAQALRKIADADSGMNFTLALCTLRGWWAAMRGMVRMDAGLRRRMLGCAVTRDAARGVAGDGARLG